ncbi:probable DNA primase large subunit isoform X2 [Fopius arisanus]|uniref:Probable DNA primase large subunit isoform X2 n=1 Tax=Fopius arisanus TaxID=64838 RepID=A0A9R1UBD2_9HYME|nr:PREDICTED: probable DNA primase large subunit isoform X2 [Fopius arisanus]
MGDLKCGAIPTPVIIRICEISGGYVHVMFYINPPRGKIPLYITEECVFNRLQYLNLLYNKEEDKFRGKFEYLLEDSPQDNVGHFTLRLLVSTTPESWNHWLTRERLLLRHRLNHLLPRQLHRLFRNILRRSKNYDRPGATCIKRSLIILSAHFLQPDVFRHIISNEHTTDCDLFPFKVLFNAVPDLVKTRKLHLDRGYGIVTCSMWKIILESLFHRLIQLEYNIYKTDMQNTVQMDPRLELMSQRVIKSILRPTIQSNADVTALNIDNEARKFPPCMRHLHLDCGMNLDNAIAYWRDEYSKPHICESGCTHKWQNNEKKFIYSIRHLYGLEGARVKYGSPNCQTIFNADPGPRYEGGCPFKILDIEQLRDVFNSCLIDDDIQEELIRLKVRDAGAACGLFLKATNDDKSQVIIQSPLEYYVHVTKTDC